MGCKVASNKIVTVHHHHHHRQVTAMVYLKIKIKPVQVSTNERRVLVLLRTQGSGRLLQNLLQLGLASAGDSPPQGPAWTLADRPSHLLDHILTGETRGSKYHYVKGPAGRGFNTGHCVNQSGTTSTLNSPG